MNRTRRGGTVMTRASRPRIDDKPVSQLTWCSIHDTEPENMFCEDHGKIICTLCRRINHYKCRSVVPISEASIRLSGSLSVPETQAITKQLIGYCGDIIKERHWDLNDIDDKKTELRDAIISFKQKLVTKIDKLVEHATADLDRVVTLEKAEVSGHIANLSDLGRKLEEDISNIRKATHDDKQLDTFIALQKASENQNNFTNIIGQIHNEAHKVTLTFDVNGTLGALLEDTPTIGSVDVKISAYNIIPKELIASNKRLRDESAIKDHEVKKPVRNRKASFTRDITVRTPDDTDICWVTGMSILSNGSLIIADHNNSSLKFISPKGNLAKTLKCKSPTFDVVLMSQTEFYVSLPDRKEIWGILLTDHNDMEKRSVIKTKFECYGLAMFREMLLVTFTLDKSVCLMNKKGVVKWSVKLDKTGTPLFEWPWYVAVDHNTDRLFVTDRRNNTLTVLDQQGKLKLVRRLNTKGPRGVALDDFGNVFMCFYMSDEIEISSVNKEFAQNVLLTKQDGTLHPQTMQYDEIRGEMVVALDNADKLLVYQMK